MTGLEDRRVDFEAARAQVLAINPASVDEHRRYAKLKNFGFPILSDPGGRVAQAFGAKVPILGINRRTVYALDPEGKVIFAERGYPDLNDVLRTVKEYRQKTYE